MQPEAGQRSHSHKVAVKRKDFCAVLNRDGGDQGIGCGQTYAFRARQAEQSCGIPVGCETAGFQKVKKGEIGFDAFDVAPQALKNLRHHDARYRHRRSILDQPPEFLPARAWPGTEEINPDGAIGIAA